MGDDIVTRLRSDELHETWRDEVVSVCCDAADEIEWLRAAGDALAIHLDAHYGLGNPRPSNIHHALSAWQEARRG